MREPERLEGIAAGSFDLDGQDAVAFVPDDGVLRIPEDRVRATLILRRTPQESGRWECGTCFGAETIRAWRGGPLWEAVPCPTCGDIDGE